MKPNIESVSEICDLKSLEDFELIANNGGLILFSPETFKKVVYYTDRFFDGFAEGFSDGVAATN